MNYTEQELEISNKSYTNKDFNTIYPELLDLVKKLTNKWDPTTSNESDPGVVLLKLWAILADKNNYNIDKNVLETFPLSVTQRANAQKLYDMLGYNMHYYKSATTDLTFWYLGNALNEDGIDSLIIPKFTMVTDDSGNNIFTILKEVNISVAKTPIYPVKAIQGIIHDYEVNGISDITLDNLDSEYRLFFNESRIAENGIFIANKGLGTLDWEEWNLVSNLESAPLNTKVYKFGVLPNTQSCYIQFPQDIGTLIGNGLKIKYIITNGKAGNINANQLTTFYNEIIPYELTKISEDSEYYNKPINDDITIQNTYATFNGDDPEDLDSAYKNYKKTIGTFNTLVTTEDYEKAIYNLMDGLGQPMASNVVVSDRTNNINYSTNIVTLKGDVNETILKVDAQGKKINVEGQGLYKKVEEGVSNPPSYKDVTTIIIDEPKMSAFDLGLHILEPMLDIDDETGYYYNKSFSVNSKYNDIISQIDGNIINENQQYYKSVEHDFININKENKETILSLNDDNSWDLEIPYIFKNFYTLNGKVITYYKVTEKEAEEIENNIKKALFRDYNARKVNFGEKIKYEDLVKTIENADTRIKTLILNEPEYTLKYMAGDDYLGSYNSAIELPIKQNEDLNEKKATQALLFKLLLKMVLGGNVQLYNFNRDVQFDFGQTNITQHKDIKSISTEKIISLYKLDSNGDPEKDEDGNPTPSPILTEEGYEVKENENIILYAPNFYTKTSYGAYVNYWFDKINAPINGYKSNAYYKLNQPIYIEYTDENGIIKRPNIPVGTCIRFVDSGDLNSSLDMSGTTINKDIQDEAKNFINKPMCTLSATQSIEVIAPNEVIFPKEDSNQTILYCMWFTNKSNTLEDDEGNEIIEYTLFEEEKDQKLLEDNEYFIYTNPDKNELVVLGSGTLLVRSNNYTPELKHRFKVSASTILEKGQTAIKDDDWHRYDLAKSSLAFVELQIISLGKGAGVKFKSTWLESEKEKITGQIAKLEDILNILEYSQDDYNKDTLQDHISTLTYYDSNSEKSKEIKTNYNKLLSSLDENEESNKSKIDSFVTDSWNAYINYFNDNFKGSIEEKKGNLEYYENSLKSYQEKLSISNSPIRISEPQYCSEYKVEGDKDWVTLDEYEIGPSTPTNNINYYKGWSIISRYNMMANSIMEQKIEEGSSITLNGDPNNSISSDKTILSNSILAFGGGKDLQLSNSNNKEINIYSFDKVNLPSYWKLDGNTTILTNFERGTDGYISIPWKDWARIEDGTYDIQDETRTDNNNGRKFRISLNNNQFASSILIPVILIGDNTKAIIKIFNINDNEISKEYTLSKNKTTDYIKIPIKESIGESITFSNGAGISLNFTYDGENTENDNSFNNINDILKIGYPRLIPSENDKLYSDQIVKTLEYINDESFTPGNLLNHITNNYPEFDLTYIINNEDAIDGEATISENWNNLFAGDLIWDKNHICNRYTIPQWNFKGSSIKVAPVYIKK